MTEPLNTRPRPLQYRGPSSSDDYNARVEENYRDLTTLKNDIGVLGETVTEGYANMAKNQLNISQLLEYLEARIEALESKSNVLSFYGPQQVDNDRFNNTSFSISDDLQCHLDDRHGILLLPKVVTSSISKLTSVNSENRVVLPSSLEMRIAPVATTVDDGVNPVDTSPPEYAFLNTPSRIWDRNVIASAPSVESAALDLYVKLPTDLMTTADTNAVIINPFPLFSVDILSIEYTTQVDVLMESSDGYNPLNTDAAYEGNSQAVGWVAPGAWSNNEDAVLDSGMRAFYFDPKPITGLRIRMRQRHYFNEVDKYIYSYGLHALDVRYDKFLPTGKTMIRFDAPAGKTISEVSSVLPRIYNVAEALIPQVFSYRIIWETSYNSGVYTTTPVSNSARVWVEVTLNQTPGKGTPALSGLTLSYS